MQHGQAALSRLVIWHWFPELHIFICIKLNATLHTTMNCSATLLKKLNYANNIWLACTRTNTNFRNSTGLLTDIRCRRWRPVRRLSPQSLCTFPFSSPPWCAALLRQLPPGAFRDVLPARRRRASDLDLSNDVQFRSTSTLSKKINRRQTQANSSLKPRKLCLNIIYSNCDEYEHQKKIHLPAFSWLENVNSLQLFVAKFSSNFRRTSNWGRQFLTCGGPSSRRKSANRAADIASPRIPSPHSFSALQDDNICKKEIFARHSIIIRWVRW